MSNPFTRAVVQGLRNREIPAAAINENVALVAAHYDDHTARLWHKLLLRHARRPGRKRRSPEYTERIVRATIWAKYNGRTDKAIATAARQHGVLKTEIVRAFSKRDSDITKKIEEFEKSPGNFLGDFPREPDSKT